MKRPASRALTVDVVDIDLSRKREKINLKRPKAWESYSSRNSQKCAQSQKHTQKDDLEPHRAPGHCFSYFCLATGMSAIAAQHVPLKEAY